MLESNVIPIFKRLAKTRLLTKHCCSFYHSRGSKGQQAKLTNYGNWIKGEYHNEDIIVTICWWLWSWYTIKTSSLDMVHAKWWGLWDHHIVFVASQMVGFVGLVHFLYCGPKNGVCGFNGGHASNLEVSLAGSLVTNVVMHFDVSAMVRVVATNLMYP